MKKTYKEFQEQEQEKSVSPKFELGSQSVSEGMTSSVARMSAIVLKKRVVGYGNRVEGSTDIILIISDYNYIFVLTFAFY